MRKEFSEFKKEALKRKEVKEIYDSLQSEFELKSQLIALRKQANLTQEEVARRMNTTKSAISRLESLNSHVSPTISTLKAYANAIGQKLSINFVSANMAKK